VGLLSLTVNPVRDNSSLVSRAVPAIVPVVVFLGVGSKAVPVIVPVVVAVIASGIGAFPVAGAHGDPVVSAEDPAVTADRRPGQAVRAAPRAWAEAAVVAEAVVAEAVVAEAAVAAGGGDKDHDE
jgi:hypothetical protein